MKNLLLLIRPHQYVKNFFIFLPIFFSGEGTDFSLLIDTIGLFIAFSVSASAVYILNDYLDIEVDRYHPNKKNRPLASGAVAPPKAFCLMIMLLVLGVSLMLTISKSSTAFLLTYILMNFGYSFYLKRISILDVTILAMGFVLRLFVGVSILEITLSKWIVMMTFLLSLFLAFAKRRDDVLLSLSLKKQMRPAIGGYNLPFVESAMIVMAPVVIVSYILYTTSIEVGVKWNSEYLYLTTLFVLLGIIRYLQITLVENDSGSPTKIALNDRFIQINLLAWVFSFWWIIYNR